jgi:hypothetical protein
LCQLVKSNRERRVIKLPPLYDNEKGVILSVALMVLAILTLAGSAAIVTTRTDLKLAGNWNAHTRTFYAAEAGLEKGIGDLKALLASTQDPDTTQLAAIAAPTFSDPSLSIESLDVQLVNSSQIVIGDGAYQGLRADATDYQITAVAKGPAGTRSRLVQMVEYLEVPLFQFGVFYGKGVDLEIAPGPPMTFNGRVHSNSNIYATNASVKFDSLVTTTGKIHRYLKRDPSTRGSNPSIKDNNGVYQSLNFDHEYNQDFIGSWSEAEWKNTAMTTFGGKVLDSAMGVEEILPPVPDALYDPAGADVAAHQMIKPAIESGPDADSAAMQGAKLYYQADVIIDGPSGQVRDKNGININMRGCDPKTVTTDLFYDARDQKTMDITTVNIGYLAACGKAPANGIMYVHRDPLGHRGAGVRLTNGIELPSGGLNVVSENPIYIHGDYNMVAKKPAAVMGDAVTILSSNWDDAKGGLPTSDRTVNDTTVNAALALGPSAESTVGQGNGQLENAIRFLEDWSGKTFTYRGSIIGLWHSQQATEPWRCCGNGGGNYYNAPNRDWGYDTLFDTVQPPGTPKGVLGLSRVAWSEGQI